MSAEGDCRLLLVYRTLRHDSEHPMACYLASVARFVSRASVVERPITADLLRRLDLRRLADAVGSSDKFGSLFGAPEASLFDMVQPAVSEGAPPAAAPVVPSPA